MQQGEYLETQRMRVQFTLDDDVKDLLDRLSKARGMSPAALIGLLAREADHQAGAVVQGGDSGAAQQVLHIASARLDQLHGLLDVENAGRLLTEKQLYELQQRVERAEETLQRLQVSLAHAIDQLEPLVGISLRPGVQFRPEPLPKRAWWHWRTA